MRQLVLLLQQFLEFFKSRLNNLKLGVSNILDQFVIVGIKLNRRNVQLLHFFYLVFHYALQRRNNKNNWFRLKNLRFFQNKCLVNKLFPIPVGRTEKNLPQREERSRRPSVRVQWLIHFRHFHNDQDIGVNTTIFVLSCCSGPAANSNHR